MHAAVLILFVTRTVCGNAGNYNRQFIVSLVLPKLFINKFRKLKHWNLSNFQLTAKVDHDSHWIHPLATGSVHPWRGICLSGTYVSTLLVVLTTTKNSIGFLVRYKNNRTLASHYLSVLTCRAWTGCWLRRNTRHRRCNTGRWTEHDGIAGGTTGSSCGSARRRIL